MSAGMIKLLLVEDHSIFRGGLRDMIETESDIKVVAEASTSDEALIEAQKQEFSIAILDISLPDSSGLDLVEKLKRAKPEIKILILSSYDESIYGLRALKSGARGYLTKDCSIEALISAVRIVNSGSTYISPQLSEMMAKMYSTVGIRSHEKLSAREFEVLKMLVRSIPLLKVATELKISTNTVKTYRTRILSKLGLKNKTQLVEYAIVNRLLVL
jgi:DNA-binding NarL/FixJ family response regulator